MSTNSFWRKGLFCVAQKALARRANIKILLQLPQ